MANYSIYMYIIWTKIKVKWRCSYWIQMEWNTLAVDWVNFSILTDKIYANDSVIFRVSLFNPANYFYGLYIVNVVFSFVVHPLHIMEKWPPVVQVNQWGDPKEVGLGLYSLWRSLKKKMY